jgi:hypothetical protein
MQYTASSFAETIVLILVAIVATFVAAWGGWP